jgi:hypothetical protein
VITGTNPEFRLSNKGRSCATKTKMLGRVELKETRAIAKKLWEQFTLTCQQLSLVPQRGHLDEIQMGPPCSCKQCDRRAE